MITPTVIVLAVDIALAVLCIAVAIVVMVMHYRNRQRELLEQRVILALRPQLVQYLDTGEKSSELLSITQRHPDLFLQTAIRMAQLLRGLAFERLQDLVESTGTIGWLRERLNSKTSFHIVEAAQALAVFRDPATRGRLRELVHSTDLSVAFASAMALARVAEKDDMSLLFSRLQHYCRGYKDLVSLILVACAEKDPQQFAGFVRTELKMDAELKALVLEVIGHLRIAETEDLLRDEILFPTSEEGPLKALRSIGECRLTGSVDLVRQALTSPRWEARTIGAWVAGQLGDLDSVSQLASMLKDLEWNVRLNAAGALALLGPRGAEALDDTCANSPDAFARDISAHALGRTSRPVTVL